MAIERGTEDNYSKPRKSCTPQQEQTRRHLVRLVVETVEVFGKQSFECTFPTAPTPSFRDPRVRGHTSALNISNLKDTRVLGTAASSPSPDDLPIRPLVESLTKIKATALGTLRGRMERAMSVGFGTWLGFDISYLLFIVVSLCSGLDLSGGYNKTSHERLKCKYKPPE